MLKARSAWMAISILRGGRDFPGGADRKRLLGRSAAAGAGRDVVDPETIGRFVSPEIHADLHRRREPDELLAEFEVNRVFLLAQKTDFEISRGIRRATRCIDGYDRGPFSLLRRWFDRRKANVVESQ